MQEEEKPTFFQLIYSLAMLTKVIRKVKENAITPKTLHLLLQKSIPLTKTNFGGNLQTPGATTSRS